jgi:glycosyltransferase involved in cell wall biosynthesis
MTTPNVALFASSFAPHLGGVEELSRRLAGELRSRGSDTVVLTNRYPGTLPADEAIDGIPVRRERFRFPEPRPRHLAGFLVGTVSTRRGIRAALAAHQSHLIHVQCVSSNGYYALRAARRTGLPLVVSLQGELTMDADQAFQRSATLRREWRALLDRADAVSGCSQQVVDEAVATYGDGLLGKVQVIPNGVDIDAVRSVVPERRERPYVFAIGRFVPQKGFDLLIRAFAEVEDEFPDHDLVLAGDGPERERLEQLAAGRRVTFLGGVSQQRAFGLYRSASGFVLPSRHEPQGIVVIEAMAAGAPVLATRVGGVAETVRDGENGLLVRGDDADELATGLRRLLGDRAGAEARATQAGHDVLSYRWKLIADRYEKCYADAIARRGARRG